MEPTAASNHLHHRLQNLYLSTTCHHFLEETYIAALMYCENSGSEPLFFLLPKNRKGRNKMAEQRLIVVNGVRYHADRPLDCALCAFWKNRKTGCLLGEAHCYYLAEAIVTEPEKKC